MIIIVIKIILLIEQGRPTITSTPKPFISMMPGTPTSGAQPSLKATRLKQEQSLKIINKQVFI